MRCPHAPGANRPTLVDTARRRPVASAHNRRALIKSWLRDRPVEATTTYRRRVGKVPNPGRTSCEIRELPSEPLNSPERSLPVPRSRGHHVRLPGARHVDRDPRPHDQTGPTSSDDLARPRITGLRCRNCGRTEAIGLSYVCAGCFGPLEVAYDYDVVGRTLTRDAIAGRGARHLAVRRAAAGGRPAGPLAAGRIDAAPGRRSPRTDPRRRATLDQGRHAQSVAQLQGPGRRGRRGPRRRVRRRGARAARRRAISRAPRPRRQRRSACRPTSSSRPTSSRPRSTTRSPTAPRSYRSPAPTTT